MHYSSTKEIVLACDASPYGVGTVISHVMENRDEKSIAYSSHTLTVAEKNYARIDKEGLAKKIPPDVVWLTLHHSDRP